MESMIGSHYYWPIWYFTKSLVLSLEVKWTLLHEQDLAIYRDSL